MSTTAQQQQQASSAPGNNTAQQQQHASTFLGSNTQTASMNYAAAIPQDAPRRPANSAARAVAAPVARPQGQFKPPRPIDQHLGLQRVPVAGGGAQATRGPRQSAVARVPPPGTRGPTHGCGQSSPVSRQTQQISNNPATKYSVTHNGVEYSTLGEEEESNRAFLKQHQFETTMGGECLTCGMPSSIYSTCKGNPTWTPFNRTFNGKPTSWLQTGHCWAVRRDAHTDNSIMVRAYCTNVLPDGTMCRMNYWTLFKIPCVPRPVPSPPAIDDNASTLALSDGDGVVDYDPTLTADDFADEA